MNTTQITKAAEITPIVIICDDCGGAGEYYERSMDRHGPDCGNVIRCSACKGEGHVTALCDMIGCRRSATSEEDGVRMCDECARAADEKQACWDAEQAGKAVSL